MKIQCGNCKFWDRQRGADGLCRFAPPTPILVGLAQQKVQLAGQAGAIPIIQGFFPPTLETAVCGCYQPTPAVEPAAVEAVTDWVA